MMVLQIIQIIVKYILLGIMFGIIIFSILSIGYFIGYKKLMRGTNNLKLSKIGLYSILIIYLMMLLDVTILSRNPMYGDIPIEVFTSYKNAVYSGECTNIILNILMFAPFGFILPVLFKKCEKWDLTYGIGLGTTLFIEILQFKTKRGIFEVDDIINNFLGCAIGFGVVMICISIIQKRNKIFSLIIYQLPLILTFMYISSIFILYNQLPR